MIGLQRGLDVGLSRLLEQVDAIMRACQESPRRKVSQVSKFPSDPQFLSKTA